ncbi:hypothetical protein SDRG_02783 [Saprolegnia diclina VS20]|uniref:Uncharacterized protein n=1 Tax=Saprolegnia diclina (strain VS20) TaxID=1156394 RepID=T0S4W4_SAPDV|nr:hypothetical protein SDRG_02783 [Saprolegnia diclina VS20]EQC40133.1 hypothetical protein SDRG_02783 [Saprolegnia diclina VS20]|eukprot:XP_008606607.1 hypothetical protein SDRG_02783 [Saprolegnia diclina VS20]
MTDGSYDDEARQLAKWKRRIAENKYIRERGLLEQSNLLSYAMHKLSHQRVPLSLSDRFTIWRLLQRGYDVNERDDSGVPPIVHAAAHGWLFFVHMFLNYDGDINVTSTIQETAVCAACRRQRSALLRYLVLRGADLDVCDKSGFSCLRWATKHQDVGMLKLLLRYGASVTKDCGTSQNSAMDWARDYQNDAMLALLERALLKEKKATLAMLEAKGSTKTIRKRAKEAATTEVAPEIVVKTLCAEERLEDTALSVRERRARVRRDQQQRDRIEAHERHAKAAFQARTQAVIQSLRPVEHHSTGVIVAMETEWRKVKSMHWQLCPLPPKVDTQTQAFVDLKRIQDLACAASDDILDDPPTPRLPRQKAPSMAFYCPTSK